MREMKVGCFLLGYRQHRPVQSPHMGDGNTLLPNAPCHYTPHAEHTMQQKQGAQQGRNAAVNSAECGWQQWASGKQLMC